MVGRHLEVWPLLPPLRLFMAYLFNYLEGGRKIFTVVPGRERESPNISRSRRQQNVGHKNFTSVHSFIAQFHCKRKHFGPPEKTLGAAAKNSNPQLSTKLFFFLKQLLLHASA
jgi:hypothetical protein